MAKKLYSVSDGKVEEQELALPALSKIQASAVRIGVSKEHPVINIDGEFSLRPLHSSDAGYLSAALYDPAHPTDPAKSPAARLSNLKQPFDEDAAKAYIDEMLKAQQALTTTGEPKNINDMGFGMAIVRKIEGGERVVGFYDAFIVEEGSADIGVALAPECQSKALGRSIYNDLERAFLDHLFDVVQVPRVLGTTALDNTTILAVWAKRGQERLGFSANESDDGRLPRHVSVLTPEQWKKNRDNRADAAPALAEATANMKELARALESGQAIGDKALTDRFVAQLPDAIASCAPKQGGSIKKPVDKFKPGT